ncbi:MAG: undecaprenyl-diphosphate phosphatase [archaeon]|jgi:undecaprenyl-diphosphatase
MDLLTAIVSGILQGIFEWLPISSQGNLLGLFTIIGSNPQEALKLAVMLHIGTLLAATIYFRKEIIEILLSLKLKLINKKEDKNWDLTKFLIIATFATSITAIPSYLFLKNFLGTNTSFVLLLLAIFLIITGFLQLFKKVKGSGELNIKNAILVGLGQGFSILPGVSRSGTTTSFLAFSGFTPQKAFRISFLLSIPAVLVAELGFGLIEGFLIDGFSIIALIFAFIVGIFSMDFLIKIAHKINFAYFCFALAIIYIIAFLVI